MADVELGAVGGTSRNRHKYLSLQIAATKGDWNAADKIIGNDDTILTECITESGETALIIATTSRHVSFVEKLMARMEPAELRIRNAKGANALCFAAATGIRKIAEVMVEKDGDLPQVSNGDGRVTPLYLAVLGGHIDMAHYLYPLSNIRSWTTKNQRILLNTCISCGLCGLALQLFNESPELSTECYLLARDQHIDGNGDGNGESRETPLEVLARKPSAFEAASQHALWRKIVNSLFPCVMEPRNETEGHKLFKQLWNHILQQETVMSNITRYASRLQFIAAKSGNVEFLVELLSSCPELLLKFYTGGGSIFHIAVQRRDENIFNLIYEVGNKDLIATMREDDGDGNNILHLAAKLPSRAELEVVSGAALQMQRELLWFKAVEKLVSPSYRDMQNHNGQTPHDLFTTEHEELMREGEKWMRGTAKSCTLVATLIATVVFTVGSGVQLQDTHNTKGVPRLSNKKSMVFFVSETIALFSSSTSILLFLSILISRCAENDFIKSLPLQWLMGMTTLFFSVAAMMVSFCTNFLLQNNLGLGWDLILLVLSVCVTIMIICLTFPLLVAIFRSTSCSCFLFQSRNRLFRQQFPC